MSKDGEARPKLDRDRQQQPLSPREQETVDANETLDDAFESGDADTVPPRADKVGTVRGTPD